MTLLENTQAFEKRLFEWEGHLIQLEEDLNALGSKFEAQSNYYSAAESNLDQIEMNLQKFESLVIIFEEKSGSNESEAFNQNIQGAKGLSRQIEDYETELKIAQSKLYHDPPENMTNKELTEHLASLFSLYNQLAQKMKRYRYYY